MSQTAGEPESRENGENYPLPKLDEVCYNTSRGPIAQWLEQPAHKKCAHALLKLLLRGAVSLKRM